MLRVLFRCNLFDVSSVLLNRGGPTTLGGILCWNMVRPECKGVKAEYKMVKSRIQKYKNRMQNSESRMKKISLHDVVYNGKSHLTK